MTVLPAASTRLPALLAAAAAALAMGGCGDGEKLLPASDASKIDTALQRVVDATDAGNCQAASEALAQAQNAFAELPAAVSAQLRERIAEGLAQLTDTVPAQCAEASTTPPTETPTTTEPTTTQTTTTTTIPPETGPTGPPEQAPPTEQPDEDTGGVAPQGNGPDGEGPPGQQNQGGGEEGDG
jgi:hypothetical protein